MIPRYGPNTLEVMPSDACSNGSPGSARHLPERGVPGQRGGVRILAA